MNKNGRPPSSFPKKNYVGIRLSDEELKELEDCKKTTGMSKTGVIRHGIHLVWEMVNSVFRD